MRVCIGEENPCARYTNEGKTILNKAKIQLVSKRIDPLESANALYSIRKHDTLLRPENFLKNVEFAVDWTSLQVADVQS
jgi:hypothetical protein